MSISHKKLINIILSVLTVFTLSFIFSNSLLSREESTHISMRVLEFFKPVLKAFGADISTDLFVRKLAHFAEFLALGAEFACLLYFNRGISFQMSVNAAFCGLLCSVTDEFLQLFSGRGSLVHDVVLDFSGVLAGILFVSAISLLYQKRKTE